MDLIECQPHWAVLRIKGDHSDESASHTAGTEEMGVISLASVTPSLKWVGVQVHLPSPDAPRSHGSEPA